MVSLDLFLLAVAAAAAAAAAVVVAVIVVVSIEGVCGGGRICSVKVLPLLLLV
jgi:hypothetical protein